MSGYVPKRVANTKTAMGSTDQRPEGSGSVMLGLVGSVGRSRAMWRAIKKKSYISMVQKDCKQNVLDQTTCNNITNSLRLFNN